MGLWYLHTISTLMGLSLTVLSLQMGTKSSMTLVVGGSLSLLAMTPVALLLWGAVGDAISMSFVPEVPSRNLALTRHSALGSEYTADIFALLFILQHEDDKIQFHLYGDF